MLFEVDPIDLHYMTDRHKRFDLKISQLKILRKLLPYICHFKTTHSLSILSSTLMLNIHCPPKHSSNAFTETQPSALLFLCLVPYVIHYILIV